MERRITLLLQIAVFGGLSQEAVELLLQQAEAVTLEPGGVFFREGEMGDALYVLELGRAAVLKRRGDVILKLAELGEGDCFGEVALLAIAPRSATVRAETEARALRIGSSALLALYQRDLEQFAMVQMNLGREVARRLRIADELLFDQALLAAASGDELAASVRARTAELAR